ncbi:Elongation factor [Macleaya cordata]|uniref:Eukaryotic translation initiation factor 5B n=1 Tax=Macleaya cordata TaxID=56857 RepID=A0A200QYU2_MACCD|nr:Elongation factor [Macleaya cordata]
MGRKKPSVRDDENPSAPQGGTSKSKKKAHVIEDDEYSIGTDLSEDPQKQTEEETALPIAGKKKGKKGNSKAAKFKDDDQEKSVEEDEDDAPSIVFSGKKLKSKKSGSSLLSSFDVLNEDSMENDDAHSGDGENADDNRENDIVEEDENEDPPVISFTGKKKSSKSSKKGNNLFAASSFDALDEGDDTKGESKLDEEDAPPITFSGKKKSSKSSKKSNNLFAAALLDEDDDTNDFVSEQQFSSRSGDVIDEIREDDEESPTITFSGKKKSSKSKKNNGLLTGTSSNTSSRDENTETEQPSIRGGPSEADGNINVDAKTNKQGSEDVTETSKSKKKKKKSGRTAQEEDDLDKILAELGEGPSIPKPTAPPPQEEKVHVQPEPVGSVEATGEEKEAEAETGESAAAKKKKKKKEKEKEKKAAAAAAAVVVEVKEEKQEETKSKISEKKLPKHVREMQEALQRRKEAEERQKKEELERSKREEEERLRQEELERQAEEARRRKKEKEKEKLLKKKQEGKLLTGRQKEEARRLLAMRNQFLAMGTVLPSADSGIGTSKRPKYQTKKAKSAPTQANGESTVNTVENIEMKEAQVEVTDEVGTVEAEEEVKEVESIVVADSGKEVEVRRGTEEKAVEDEEDEDEEWDAKSWDDADVNLPVKSAFADEEAETEPESEPVAVVKKEIKHITSQASGDTGSLSVAAKPAAASRKDVSPPMESQDVDGNGHNGPSVEAAEKNRKKDAAKKREARTTEAHLKRSADNLRSPICCIMGHVDTGKTKLLDCIRGTNVQEGEAGGITQQIGATYFPAENIRERTKELKADATLRVPGLLVIDTPGHESFTNLRSRGSGLCDIAILVVDIMHGLEPQTIESLNLLKMRNTEFIVALNKVDRLYGWKTCPNAPIVKAMKQQSNDVQNEFKMRLTQIITQFKEQGLNTELYYKNKEMGETFSIVPTSAISGEGIPDMLLLLVQWTQKTMVEKLMFSNEVQCTVLEVKVIEGLGTTIDVVLVNGVLHEGDQIVVCGMQGPIVTTIRALLTPHPMKELRIKGSYLHHKELKAAQGIKITAQGLEHAIAGTGLYVVGPEDDVEDVKETTMQDMRTVMSRIDKSGEGVCVQASTLGSLEALLEFLKSPAVNIPVSGISIGPVHKKDVMRASVMLERKKEYATILAFDVKVTPEARELADESGVKIFIADIIYHLFDQFKAYIDNLKEEKKKEAAEEAVFPCVLKIMPNCVFNKKDPIVLGVDVLEGIAKVGTPICIPSREFIDIGRIASIEINHKQVDAAKKGQKVAIKIASSSSEEQQKMFGRHFEMDDELVSHISRKSIDILKANYRDDLSTDEWRLVVKLKNLFKIHFDLNWEKELGNRVDCKEAGFLEVQVMVYAGRKRVNKIQRSFSGSELKTENGNPMFCSLWVRTNSIVH